MLVWVTNMGGQRAQRQLCRPVATNGESEPRNQTGGVNLSKAWLMHGASTQRVGADCTVCPRRQAPGAHC